MPFDEDTKGTFISNRIVLFSNSHSGIVYTGMARMANEADWREEERQVDAVRVEGRIRSVMEGDVWVVLIRSAFGWERVWMMV
jgi:hypothetical protein